ncbi:NAD(P)H-dependent flavin oxidoreductase [Nocardia cyriacigeorgica]|uniref:Nitronate monooxygenase n=1 Tax=Nocardia cyriacigeorgica TaxID=135487 RepID=A0A4V6IBU6_9NOCA|nr:nitronate monooxygenase [Nocardia cyriacigeorgica]VFA97143.1 Nitronate monooxygenase [Nocardia cyriacigeorgica]
MLSTAWSRAMGLRVPIVNAPMGGVAGGRLAAAVTAAGGLGMIGMGSAGSAARLSAELEQLGPDPGPFGIGMIDWVLAREPDLFDTALAARPALISISFTADLSWVERVHAAGIRAATQVYDREQALRAEAAGIDVIVARGAEGGGHGEPTLATLPLLEIVCEAVEVPVLAAGGIATGHALAAVLGAGAAGAWLGTRLAVCPEALTTERARAALLRADATDTITTRVFDIGQGLPWPARYPARVLRNDFTDRWDGAEAALAADPRARAELAAAIDADDPRLEPIDAGQGIGLVTSSQPVAEVFDDICTAAARYLTARSTVAESDAVTG